MTAPLFRLNGDGTLQGPAEKEGEFFVLPGMVNAHSHSFQRMMRGLVERKNDAHQDDFWSWRRLMYQIAAQASPQALKTVATWCFLDCLKSGFTHVGEFHYLHHRPDGTQYAPTHKIAQLIMEAAAETGIRLTVLHTAYHWAGPNRPAQGAQKRFVFPSVEDFLQHVARALADGKPRFCDHGLAIHSIRAVPPSWLAPIAAFSQTHELALHIHACEQPQEVETCRQAYGSTPIQLLHDHGVLGPNTTLVHGTHVTEQDIELIARSGSKVCICPSTERNLGDGLAPIADYLSAQVPIVIGTDSHARIDAVDELRSLEDHERLRLQRRLVWLDHAENLVEALLPVACVQGAASLLPGRPDQPTDEVWVRIPPHLRTASPQHVAEDWILGGSGRDVSRVRVGGEFVLENGRSTRIDEEQLGHDCGQLLRQL